jgi:hypothetical protein
MTLVQNMVLKNHGVALVLTNNKKAHDSMHTAAGR